MLGEYKNDDDDDDDDDNHHSHQKPLSSSSEHQMTKYVLEEKENFRISLVYFHCSVSVCPY